MKLLVIRHAKAEDASAGQKDADRRLTDEGRKDMRRIAKGLREITPDIGILAASPLLRAGETAEIVAEVLDIANVVELPLLAPDGDKHALIAWLKEQPAQTTAAIVGHEPQLSSCASLLITGEERPVLALKKGACCLIELEDAAAGGGTLLWLLQPKQLRKIDG